MNAFEQNQAFENGVASAKAGNHVLARMHLQQAIASEPENEEIWFWLAWVSESPSSAADTLRWILSRNPDHHAARAGLMWMTALAEFDPATGVGIQQQSEASEFFRSIATSADGTTHAGQDEQTADETESVPFVERVEDAAGSAIDFVQDAATSAYSAVKDVLTGDSSSGVARTAETAELAEAEHPTASDDSLNGPATTPALRESALDRSPTVRRSGPIIGDDEWFDRTLVDSPPMRAEIPSPIKTEENPPAGGQQQDDASGPRNRISDVPAVNVSTSSDENTDISANATAAEEAVGVSEEELDDRASARFGSNLIPRRSSKPLIMIVDDSPTVRKLVSMTLEEQNYDVVTADDGRQAIDVLESVSPKLILMDINMPRLDGYRLCKLVKRHEATRHIPVVMLSGQDGMFDRLRGRLVGCTEYITKPFDPDELSETVKRNLQATYS